MCQHAPLVVAEVVQYDEEHFVVIIQQREHPFLEYLVGHEWLGSVFHPFKVVLLDIFGKPEVGLFLLHDEHLGHRPGVGA